MGKTCIECSTLSEEAGTEDKKKVRLVNMHLKVWIPFLRSRSKCDETKKIGKNMRGGEI